MRYTFTMLMLSTLALALAQSASSNTQGRKLFMFDKKSDFRGFFLTRAQWDDEKSGFTLNDGAVHGWVESPEIQTIFPCNEVVVSWNSDTPPGSYLTIYIQTKTNGLWSRKYTVGIWNRDNRPTPRMSVGRQRDGFGYLKTDTLYLKQPADAFRVYAKLSSADRTTSPTLKLLAVHTLDSTAYRHGVRARKSVWGKELAVPPRSQLTVPEGNRFCSATSTAMLLDYWALKLGRPELTVHLQTAVDGIYDKGWNGTGNWPFNTAYAAEFGGLKAYVHRLGSVSEIERWIEKDVPLAVSVNYNALRNRPGRSGHLMVICGFTEDGDCIINDPATNLEKGQIVRRVYNRADFERSWLDDNARGSVYVIYPYGWAVPAER